MQSEEKIIEETTVEETVEEAVEETAEETVEETVEEAAEEVVEETAEEAVEEAVEETTEETAEEPTEDTNEMSGEESTEDTAEVSEEESTEDTAEVSEEESTEDTAEVSEEEPKKKKGWKIVGIVAAAMVTCLIVSYFIGVLFYNNHLFMRTTVNHINCSNMTIEEVKEELQKGTKAYQLTIECVDGTKEIISGSDFNLTYEGSKDLEKIFKKQNPFVWPKALFVDTAKKATIKLQYSKDNLRTLLCQMDCMQEEKQIRPIAATVVFEDGTFVIKEEQNGTQIDVEKLVQVANQRVRELRPDVNLTQDECYVAPKFLKDSESVLNAQKEMNEYLNAEITYQSNSKEVVLGPETFATWIVPTEDMIPSINEQEVRNFTKELTATYNTPNRSGTLVTPKGKSVTMSNACLGSAVNVEWEVAQIIADIKSGKEVTREPLYSRRETVNGNFVWGKTYIEVDISEQHLWYIVNGSIRLETPVITGMKGSWDTPTGIFRILEKRRNKTLVGPTVNGKPLYRQPVHYWMRVTWSGVGLHDAGWHTVFGGDRYLTSGSHGCINMPPWKAGQLYGMIGNGTYVVIHY